jgi:hypothetical protein
LIKILFLITVVPRPVRDRADILFPKGKDMSGEPGPQGAAMLSKRVQVIQNIPRGLIGLPRIVDLVR